MSNEAFRREKMYQGSLSVAKAMLRRGIITEDEYGQIEDFLLEKYQPMLGSLFAHSR